MSKVFQQKLGTKMNSSKVREPLKINFLSLASVPWLWPCLRHQKKKQKKKKHAVYNTCDVKVMIHLNFGKNNGKTAAVTSWGLGDGGGKLRLGGRQLEAWGGHLPPPPQHPPNDAPGWNSTFPKPVLSGLNTITMADGLILSLSHSF